MNSQHLVQQKFPSILALVKSGINIKEASLANGIGTTQLYKFITPIQNTELKQVKVSHALNNKYNKDSSWFSKSDLQAFREAFYDEEV